MRGQTIALPRARNFVRLMKLENQLGKQVGLMPPLLVDLPHELVVGVRHALHLATEHVEHFNMSFWTAQEPEAELAHECWGDAAIDNASPRRNPVAKLLRGDILKKQIIPRE